MMTKQQKSSKGDVYWYDLKYQGTKSGKPFAYSTVATSNLIVALSQKYNTIQEVYDAINYDDDAINILKQYIDWGYGNYIARNYFK